ncbi:hypothetical protein Leryth_006674 [Lithospermum erythrorhizon]|uniref:Hydroxyproline-rich glycoprotein family protein n=1 Tax=Lithospermum erythrorhizon TaxID=34254 RepID=A0AAV3P855_LITER|nr:hypothetical protein Leryth_006674 [Lithospermum erythrorhizon]
MSMQSESLPPLAPPPYYYHNNDSNAARPSLGFPLGTALLLIVIFSLSGVFSCCYHWDKLRSFTRSFSHQTLDDLEAATQHGPSKPKPNHMSLKGKVENESYTVLMPGDEVPKFIAMPCPCQPSRSEGNIHLVELPKPPKPPRMAVPLYC